MGYNESMRDNQAKKLMIVVFAVVVLLIVIALSNALSHVGKTQVFLEVAPSIASSAIDGKSVDSGAVYVSKGKHVLTSQLSNFTTVNQPFTVTGESRTISLALTPSNAAGRKFLADNPAYQTEREAVSGREVQGRRDVATTPLISQLPIINLAAPYRIDFGQSKTRKDGVVILIGGSSPEGRQKALELIRSKGYDPTTLEIQFTDFSSPLNTNGVATPQSSSSPGGGGE